MTATVQGATKRAVNSGARNRLARGLVLAAFVLLGSALAVQAQEAAMDDASAASAAAADGEAPTTPDVSAPGDDADDGERIDELESKVDVIAEELSKAITSATVPEDWNLESFKGLGPGASKVYYRDKGLSVGSYGEVLFRKFVTPENDGTGGTVQNDDIFDALRAVLYVGYKFNDKWVVNSELEFEHAGTGGGGSVSIEFLTVDYLARDWLNVRTGLLLVPMGFINEIHEPNFFFGADRPEVERVIIPTTWRENGVGIFGTIADRVEYRIYGVNGFDARGFSVGGLRGGRQKGSRAIANDWAFVARADVDVIGGLMVGGSVYTGNSGQNQTNTRCTSMCGAGMTPVLTTFQVPDTLTTIYEVHAEYRRYGLKVRALLTQAFIGDAALLNLALGNAPTSGTAIASEMLGWYGEIGYDILPLIFPDTKHSFEPFFRYERVDTQQKMPTGFVRNRKFIQDIYTVGFSYKPIPGIVFKFDYRHYRPASDPQDRANEVQFLAGYVF